MCKCVRSCVPAWVHPVTGGPDCVWSSRVPWTRLGPERCWEAHIHAPQPRSSSLWHSSRSCLKDTLEHMGCAVSLGSSSPHPSRDRRARQGRPVTLPGVGPSAVHTG